MSDIDAVDPVIRIEASEAAIDESISTLSNCPDVLPTQAVLDARSHWEDFFPRLLDEMRSAIAMAREDEVPGEIAFWGVALIAERRPGEVDEALPVLIEILSLPHEQIDLLISDLLTQFVPQALANAAGKDVSLLEGMFADPAIDASARWAVGNALLRLVADGVVPRERAVNLFHRQLQEVLEEHRSGTYSDDVEYPTALVVLLYDLLPHEAVADMEAAFAARLAEAILIDATAVRERAEQGEAAYEQAMSQIRESRLDDSLAILEQWYEHELRPDWSTEEDSDLDPDEDEGFEEDFETDDFTPVPAVETIRREQAKVGRNDPCPCGSGRKYKKCCGRS